ncbi:hypothetical protein [Kovacikia minuta]|nr:hypothetical protein [Kovacikia minuta]
MQITGSEASRPKQARDSQPISLGLTTPHTPHPTPHTPTKLPNP